MKKDKLFAKIPNNFFYDGGKILEEIGGRNSFTLYCLITSRKSMNNKMHITIREINKIIPISKNITDARERVIKYLSLLKIKGLVEYNFMVKEVKNNDFIEIEWIDNFPKKEDAGWIAFYADDFDLLNSVGVNFYVVHWVLRMYVNHEKQVSYIAIRDIASILKCRIVEVQRAIDLFDYSGLFKIERGQYYYNYDLGRKMKNNNEYKYTDEKDWILKLGMDKQI